MLFSVQLNCFCRQKFGLETSSSNDTRRYVSIKKLSVSDRSSVDVRHGQTRRDLISTILSLLHRSTLDRVWHTYQPIETPRSTLSINL